MNGGLQRYVLRVAVEARAASLYTVGGGEVLVSKMLDVPAYSISDRGERIPFIPGSVVKGWLKTAATLAEKTLGLDSDCGSTILGASREAWESLYKKIAPSCLLFGTPLYPEPSLLHVTGLRGKGGFHSLYHISLSKTLLTVEERHLFRVEYYAFTTVFQGTLELRPLTTIRRCIDPPSGWSGGGCGKHLYQEAERRGWATRIRGVMVDPPPWLVRFMLLTLYTARITPSGRRGGILDLRVKSHEAKPLGGRGLENLDPIRDDPPSAKLLEELREWRWHG